MKSVVAVLQGLPSKIRWHINQLMYCHLWVLNIFGCWFTVLDAFGAPGDTLMAATVCHIIKRRYPRIRINLITKWPAPIRLDPSLAAINADETYFSLRFWYLETVSRKESQLNVLLETLSKIGISTYDYSARVYLSTEELDLAETRLQFSAGDMRPKLGFCTTSKEKVKNWPYDYWKQLLALLRSDWQLIHLGDDREPEFTNVHHFAGKLSMRESMAVLSHCHLFVGPDSFLMHAANGLSVPSVILFGGSRPAASLGYAVNDNIYVPMPCGPCWLHDSRGDICAYDIICMKRISVAAVHEAIDSKLKSTVS